MKRYLWLIGAAILLCTLLGSSVWYMQHHQIILRLPSGFFPKIVHIQKNESITFINLTSESSWPAAGPHPTHTSYPEFDAKRGIAPLHSWTFTFAKEGAYTFHDHYAPQMDGIVISGSNDISLVTDQKTCDAISDKTEQASCIAIYFKNITETVGYSQARAIYEDIAARYPNSCHGFAHDLGKNAYRAYLNGTLPEIGQESSSCAYGLWHGFTTAMQEDQGFEASKEFCASFKGATEELQTTNRINCYHGIGIGLIPDPPRPDEWGNFQRMVDPALNFCDTIQGNPEYKTRCLTGVFHAMTTDMINDQYGLTFDENSLAYCAAQKPEHQYACFITLAPAIPRYTGRDLNRTIATLRKYSPTQDLFLEMFVNAAIMSVDTDAKVEELGNFVEKCEVIETDLRPKCIDAVIDNLYQNGTPGIEYVKVAEFCSGAWMHDTEKEACFNESISNANHLYAPEKLVEVCDKIPDEYRSRISLCKTPQ